MPTSIPGLKHDFNKFKSKIDGIELNFRSWMPEQQINSVVVLHHGFGDHGGRYKNMIQALNDGKTGFYSIDARGHGHSEGKRGHVKDFAEFKNDLDHLIDMVHEKHPETPVILLGHSMGSVVAIDYCISEEHQKKLAALITSAPALIIEMDFVKYIKKFIASKLSRVAPGLVLNAGLDLKHISSCPKAQKAYSDDDLVHGLISVSLGNSFLEIGNKLLERSSNIKLPVFIFQGTADKIASPTSSELLYKKIGSSDKTLKMYQDRRHEIFNETEEFRKLPMEELSNWYQNIKSELIS